MRRSLSVGPRWRCASCGWLYSMDKLRCGNCNRTRGQEPANVVVIIDRSKGNRGAKKIYNGMNTWGRNALTGNNGSGVQTWGNGLPWG